MFIGGYLCFHPSSCRHNDLAYQIRVYFQNQLDNVDLTKNGSGADPKIYGDEWQTDIPRLRAGKVGGQVSWYLFQSLQPMEVMSRSDILGYFPSHEWQKRCRFYSDLRNKSSRKTCVLSASPPLSSKYYTEQV